MRPGKFLAWIGYFLVFVNSAAAATEPENTVIKALRVDSNRLFGRVLGDIVHQNLQFDLDRPYRLLSNLLPRPGPLEPWLDLRRINVRESEHESGTRYEIALIYQIFPAIKESESREIPGLILPISNADQRLDYAVPSSQILINPLIPKYLRDNDVDLRPPIKPQPLPLAIHRRKLALLCVLLALVGILIAAYKGLLPFSRPSRSPFAVARRKLRRYKKQDHCDQNYQSALRIVHQAFNEKAGKTLFAANLNQFFEAHPDFLPLQYKTSLFFSASQHLFFTGGPNPKTQDYSIQWLDRLCREYHKIEQRNP